jgi:hypothetical protein
MDSIAIASQRDWTLTQLAPHQNSSVDLLRSSNTFWNARAVTRRGSTKTALGRRFETRWLTVAKNLSTLADLSGQWIDAVDGRRPPRDIVLDMDSSVSPTHGLHLLPSVVPVQPVRRPRTVHASSR